MRGGPGGRLSLMGDRDPGTHRQVPLRWVRPACPAQPQLQSAPSGSICARIRSDGRDRRAGQPGSAEGSADGAPRPLTCCACCPAWGSGPSSWPRVSAACGAMPACPVRVRAVLGTALDTTPGTTPRTACPCPHPRPLIRATVLPEHPCLAQPQTSPGPGTPTLRAAGNVGVTSTPRSGSAASRGLCSSTWSRWGTAPATP